MKKMKLFRLPCQMISSEEIENASKVFSLSIPTLMKYQRSFEQHVNSDVIRNYLSIVTEPFKDIYTNSNVCGFSPVGQEWEVCFPATSPISVNVSSCGNPYILINLNLFPNLPFNERILSLGHENVHLKQMEEGRLIINGSKVLWEGDDWSERYIEAQKKLVLENHQELYRALPWEVEAYAFEEKLRDELR
ncbi:hypothetical protein BCT67_17935 [Vibrio breoganii]|nr:hypothetical protein BCT67_17935 [Vibrio breoganii]